MLSTKKNSIDVTLIQYDPFKKSQQINKKIHTNQNIKIEEVLIYKNSLFLKVPSKGHLDHHLCVFDQ